MHGSRRLEPGLVIVPERWPDGTVKALAIDVSGFAPDEPLPLLLVASHPTGTTDALGARHLSVRVPPLFRACAHEGCSDTFPGRQGRRYCAAHGLRPGV